MSICYFFLLKCDNESIVLQNSQKYGTDICSYRFVFGISKSKEFGKSFHNLMNNLRGLCLAYCATKEQFLRNIPFKLIKRKHQPNGWCFSFAVGHQTEINWLFVKCWGEDNNALTFILEYFFKFNCRKLNICRICKILCIFCYCNIFFCSVY